MNGLKTPRLSLAPIRERDIDVLHGMLIDEGVRRFLCDDKIVPRSFAEDLVTNSLDSFRTHNMGLWLIHESTKTDAIGFCMLRPSAPHPNPELLYALLPRAWRRGLAIEAANAVLDHAFNTLGYEEVFAEMDESNKPSTRVVEKLGMTFAGSRPGLANTLLRYTLTRKAFLERGR